MWSGAKSAVVAVAAAILPAASGCGRVEVVELDGSAGVDDGGAARTDAGDEADGSSSEQDGSSSGTDASADDDCELALAFTASETDASAHRDLYLKDLSGETAERLVRHADASIKDPSWSPDGSAIAFSSETGGNEQIYVYNLDDGTEDKLTSGSVDESRNPRWSPDGTQIAFERVGSDDTDIWIMGADGSEQRPVTERGDVDVIDADPWHPSGDRLLFTITTTDPFKVDIYSVKVDGSAEINLTNTDGTSLQPVWSPDGGRIVYSESGLRVMSSDGSASAELADSGLSPDWSPDGKQIVFQTSSKNFIVNEDGSGLLELSDVSSTGGAPDYSPDGTTILTRRGSAFGGGLFVVDSAGGEPEQLDTGLFEELDRAWRPCR